MDPIRLELCDICGRSWHALPEFYEGKTCPGGWASDDDRAAWREMFTPSTPVTRQSPGHDRRWQASRGNKVKLLTEQYDFTRTSFKVALFHSTSNVRDVDNYFAATGELPNGGGYARGGIAVSMTVDFTRLPGWNSPCRRISFAYNPVWSATSGGFLATYAAIWQCESGDIIASLPLQGGRDVKVSNGCTLTIDSDGNPNPVMALAL